MIITILICLAALSALVWLAILLLPWQPWRNHILLKVPPKAGPTPDLGHVTVVIPARNEAKDIAATLEACLAIEYGPKEIIVVDDSTDETPQIVGQYAERGVRLIHRSQNRNGCCGARNLGMQSAEGEIIVLMNADNRPRPDFLQRLIKHYQEGADFVVVRSMVLNRDNPWGQFIFASSMPDTHPDPLWSEGFSCRKSAAKAVGYIPGDFPIPFCRDNAFGKILGEARFVKHIDRNIEMEHVSPSTLPEFWRNQVWRGTISAPHAYYLRKISLPVVMLREIAKACRRIIRTASLLIGLDP